MRTAGAELAFAWQPSKEWKLRATYNFFDDDIERELESSPLAPNASRHRFTIGGVYRTARLELALDWRHVQGFDWRSGLYVGPVPTHDVVNARALYDLAPGWSLAADVENLLDSNHYEQFGANLLKRRALLSIRRTW